MNKADPLMAALRPPVVGKATSRAGHQAPTDVKDGKDKIEHFREQLRLIAQGAKRGNQSDTEGAEPDATQDLQVPDHLADIIDHETTRPKDRIGQSKESSSHQAAAEATSLPPEWRGPEAALSSVMSRLDQAQAFSPREDGATLRLAQPEADAERRTMSLKADESIKASKVDALSKPGFASSVDVVEIRTPPAVKVVVREQETHFEPVQQVSLLQKIVDRLAPDLPAASTQAPANSADVALPNLQHAADKPVRVLTLQLEPPSIGTVTVRMRMAGDAVEVHLSADRYETAQMLRQDRDALTDLMQSAGYTFDIAAIDHSHASDANPGSAQSQGQSEQQQSQQPQQSQNGSQSGGGSSERQSSDAQGGARQHRQGHDQITERAAQNRDQQPVRNKAGGGALYL